MSSSVITIGRSFGSGGHEIAQALSQQLHVPFYDKNLLYVVAEKNGLNSEILDSMDEKPSNSPLFSDPTRPGFTFSGVGRKGIAEEMYEIQARTIKELAESQNCIIVGRCADFILKEADCNLLSVFIDAPMGSRVERIMRVRGVSATEAKIMITHNDKERSAYHNYYANQKWGHCGTYHLTLDSSKFGQEGCIALIAQAFAQISKG